MLRQEQEAFEKMKQKYEQELKDPKLRKKLDPGDWELNLIKRRDNIKKRETIIKENQAKVVEHIEESKLKNDDAKRKRKELNEKYKDNAAKIVEIEKEKEQQIKFIKD